MNFPRINVAERQAAIHGLAIVGFVALVATGMWLAVYSARYVPAAVSRLGAAAVSLGSVFVPGNASLSVVPVASTTIAFGDATSTPASTTPVLTVPSVPAKAVTPTAGAKTENTIQIGGNVVAPAPTGQPDLVVSITNVGYLATSSTDSFVVATTVPNTARPAVRFTIKNIGGGATGSWRFSASIPTATAYLYQSTPQPSLNPGDSIDYTLGFDQANKGTNQKVSITANYDNVVKESDTTNDTASASLTILGS